MRLEPEVIISFIVVVVGIIVLWFLIGWIDRTTQHLIGRLLGFKDPKKTGNCWSNSFVGYNNYFYTSYCFFLNEISKFIQEKI